MASPDHLITPEQTVRFWSRVDKDGPTPAQRPELGPCWIWRGPTTSDGYGRVWTGSRTDSTIRRDRAHRVAYALLGGEIPEGLTLDHLCHNATSCTLGDKCPHRRCCNPFHVELATNRVNILRGNGHGACNARKTHCPKGHPYSGVNLYVRPQGERMCRECYRDRKRRSRAKPAQATMPTGAMPQRATH